MPKGGGWQGDLPITYSAPAGADLSATLTKYAALAFDSNGDAVLANISSDVFIGVLHNLPKSAEHAQIAAFGQTKARAGAAITRGNVVVVQSGWFIAGNRAVRNNSLWLNINSKTKAIGLALETATSGGIFTLQLFDAPTVVESA